MPELPEVEVVKRTLAPRLVGRRIERVEARPVRLREPIDVGALEGLAGARFTGLDRRAKYLLAHADDGRTLVVHLGMSGRLTLVPSDTGPEPHEHLAVHLGSGSKLRFRDPRRFGRVRLVATDGLDDDRLFRHLGVEPLGGAFDGETLAAAARGRRGPVKPFLMDATVVVGVGNIYASEALHRAGVHPRRSVARISAARWERLARAVRAVLEAAIEQGGTTLNDFTDGAGERGWFQVSLTVYGREGAPCPRCGRALRRITQAGRGTFYCPGCQR